MLFTVDVFNEGLDIPDVDTVLFLRPTESSTIFMQQLGRGLRRTHTQGRPDGAGLRGLSPQGVQLLAEVRGLTGIHGKQLEKAVKEDFPFLPSGCQVRLDKQTQEVVLENLKSQIANRWAQIVAQLRATKDDSTGRRSSSRSGLELSDILRRGSHSWTKLRQDAGLETLPGSELEERLLKRVRAFAHVDDPQRARCLPLAPARRRRRRTPNSPPGEQRIARMLYYSFWYDGGGFESYRGRLRRHAPRSRRPRRDGERGRPQLRGGSPRATRSGRTLWPTSRSRSTLAISGKRSWRRSTSRACPTASARASSTLADRNVDAFFITLKKSEADYSPTTMYADYPISRDLFHWESQSTTSVNSPTGRRYLDGSSDRLALRTP